jgi:hypothetical protein
VIVWHTAHWDETEEQHEARLAEERRSADATRAWMDAMQAGSRQEIAPRRRAIRPSGEVIRKPRRGN